MSKPTGSFLQRVWYGPAGPAVMLCRVLLLPLTLLFAVLSATRRLAYRGGLLRQNRFPLPVIVIGNITVGGTGKTPMVQALVERLKAAGWRPGVVSRGYGGKGKYPLSVNAETPVQESGDEPYLMARRCGCPVVVDPDRSRAIRHMLAHHDVDIVVSDDGMQHYAMARDAEIAVIDARRRLGNGLLLPAGPLREPAGRLRAVDMVMVNGGDESEAAMHLKHGDAIHLQSGKSRALQDFAGQSVHAVAGIGHPGRFFAQLSHAGLKVSGHAMPDHHLFTAQELSFNDALPVLMTEKDAVKCRDIAHEQCWYVPVTAQFNTRAERLLEGLLARLQALRKQNG